MILLAFSISAFGVFSVFFWKPLNYNISFIETAKYSINITSVFNPYFI